MTTKEQERKALEQIKKIVEGLGENSYIGTAFEGCFEIAEDNINNDFACSMKQRKEAAEFAEDQLRKKVAQMKVKIREQEAALKVAENGKTTAESVLEKIRKANETNQKAAIENWNKFREVEDKLEAKEAEIIKLKAKLYDLMVGTVA